MIIERRVITEGFIHPSGIDEDFQGVAEIVMQQRLGVGIGFLLGVDTLPVDDLVLFELGLPVCYRITTEFLIGREVFRQGGILAVNCPLSVARFA